METISIPDDLQSSEECPGVKSFLHSLFEEHLQLHWKYEETLMGEHNIALHLTKISIEGVETKALKALNGDTITSTTATNDNEDTHTKKSLFNEDFITFHIPDSLQPGYDPIGIYSSCEDIDSPILPLIRCLGAAHVMRLFSALLCERRVMLLSSNVSKLAACVQAAAGILTQGLLIWRYIKVPVMPAHLFKYLTKETPFLVGIVRRYATKSDIIKNLTNVLYVDLDKNEFKTYGINNPNHKIPDLLAGNKRRRNTMNSINGFNSAEVLARDLASVLDEDRRLWRKSTKEDSKKDVKDKHATKKEEIDRQHFEPAAFFGSIIRATIGRGSEISGFPEKNEANNGNNDEEKNKKRDDNKHPHLNPTAKSTLFQSEGWTNEGAEEMIRASFVCFFLEIYGDMGMYLSKSKEGSFCLDKNKFLMRKKQLGMKEDSPM